MTIRIGNEVVLPQGQPGILRWTGRIQGKPLEYAGVELVGPNAKANGKHSGEYDGHKYFSTEVPGTGLFVSYSQLVSANVQTTLARIPSDASQAESVMSAASSLGERRQPSHFSEIDQLERTLAERSAECERLRAQLERAGSAEPNGAANDETLRRQIDEKEQRIQKMRESHEQKREEFRSTISQLENDRNAMADNYEERLKALAAEYEQKLHAQAGSGSNNELETQRAALAAMQNQMLSESERLREQREQLDAAQKEFERGKASRGDEDLDVVLQQLETQEHMLNEMRESISELDALRETEKNQRKQIEELRKAQPNAPAASVDELKRELEETKQQLSLARIELHSTKRQLESTTATLEETQQELESTKSELMPVKAGLVSAKVELETTKNELEQHEPASESDDRMQMASLRSELAAARSELEKSRSQSKMLLAELESMSGPGDEARRLERALEAKVVHEAELEAELERLTKPPVPSEPASPKTVLPEAAPPKVESKPDGVVTPPADAAAGRELWCGLCEREGHTAEECPYDE